MLTLIKLFGFLSLHLTPSKKFYCMQGSSSHGGTVLSAGHVSQNSAGTVVMNQGDTAREGNSASDTVVVARGSQDGGDYLAALHAAAQDGGDGYAPFPQL